MPTRLYQRSHLRPGDQFTVAASGRSTSGRACGTYVVAEAGPRHAALGQVLACPLGLDGHPNGPASAWSWAEIPDPPQIAAGPGRTAGLHLNGHLETVPEIFARMSTQHTVPLTVGDGLRIGYMPWPGASAVFGQWLLFGVPDRVGHIRDPHGVLSALDEGAALDGGLTRAGTLLADECRSQTFLPGGASGARTWTALVGAHLNVTAHDRTGQNLLAALAPTWEAPLAHLNAVLMDLRHDRRRDGSLRPPAPTQPSSRPSNRLQP